MPSIDYKVFETRPDPGSQGFADTIAANLATKVLENEWYTLTLGDIDNIVGILDRNRGNREFVRSFPASDGTTTPVNSFGAGVGSIETGTVLTAKLLANGGHYAPRKACCDWLMINLFVDVTGGGFGVTLSNPDLSFFKVGESTINSLDTTRPPVRKLAGGSTADRVGKGFVNQGGATSFLQRFALQTHAGYNQTTAMKFSFAHQTPFVARGVAGGAKYAEISYSLLKTTSAPKVMLTALEVAEEGISRCFVARVWNSATVDSTFKFSGALAASDELTHIESYKAAAPPGDIVLKTQEMAAFLLR